MSFKDDKYKKIYRYCNTYLRKHLEYPSLLEIINYAKTKSISFDAISARRFRNSLEGIYKYTPTGIHGKLSKKLFAQTRISSLGTIQFDIGFFTQHGKQYGMFAIAIDILSRKIFVKKISKREFKYLKQFFSILISEPGFTWTRRIYSDNEGGLSPRNIRDLEASYPGIRWIRIGGKKTEVKAWFAENAIKNFKRKIALACIASKVHLSKWYTQMELVVQNINNKKIKNTNFTPNDINKKTIHNFLDELYKNNPNYELALYSIQNPLDKKQLRNIFKYNIDDEVAIRKSTHIDLPEAKEKFEKKSVAGHYDKNLNIYLVVDRKLIHGKNNVFPIYTLKQKYSHTPPVSYTHLTLPTKA